MDALACGIAVCSDFSEGEFQIVIILGLRTISVGIPAPGLFFRRHDSGSAVCRACTAPEFCTGQGIASDNGLGKFSHLDGVCPRLAGL